MHVRVSRFTGGSPGDIDEAAARLTDDLLPRMREMEGFQGVIACANRSTGDQLALTFWADEAAMQASDDAANRMREEDLGESEEIAGVERYEVVKLELI